MTMPRNGGDGGSARERLWTVPMATAVPRLWPTRIMREEGMERIVRKLRMLIVSVIRPVSVGVQVLWPKPL